MKTIDILNLLGAYNRVYDDPHLTNEEKRFIGVEVLHQLPKSALIPSVAASLDAAFRSIKDRVNTLEADANRQPDSGRPEGQKEPGKSLRKAKPNA